MLPEQPLQAEEHLPLHCPFEQLVVGMLEQQAEPLGDDARGNARDPLAGHPDIAAQRPQQTIEQSQQGRFAGAVRTGHRHNFAGTHLQVDVLQQERRAGIFGIEAERHALQLQGRR